MPIAKKNNIPQDFLNQMKSNLTKETSENAEETASEKKEKYADVMNVRLSKGRRNEIKAFCTNCGITVTQYIESSFEFLAKEVADGNVIISKGGITKITH